MPYCLIFPGQGTQFPGMSKGLTLSAAIDDDLLMLMESGDDELLSQTTNAQPAVLSVSAALWEGSAFKDPAYVMGHSLGEYTALVAAGSLSVPDAINLVRKRASLMDSSRPKGAGAMAAVLGLSEMEINDAIKDMKDIWIANLNGAGQVVISGSAEAIEKASVLLKQKGAKRIVPLKVSVASHCPFMDKAKDAIEDYLEGIHLSEPRCPIISNVSAEPVNKTATIKNLLAQQLIAPVRFEQSIQKLASLGIDHFIEIGPRSVLAPLVKRILVNVKIEVITNDKH